MTTPTGDGLELRPLGRDDADALRAGEDDAQIAAFEFPGPAPLGRVLDAIDEWTESWAGGGPVRSFGIFEAATQQLCGTVEVRDLGDGRVALSYSVFPEFRRRGIANAASRLALGFARRELGARVVQAKVLDWNTASLAVAASLGLRRVRTEPSRRGGTFVVLEGPLRP